MAWNHTVRRLLENDTGQGLAEYAFILALIALSVIGAVGTLGQTILQAYTDIVNTFP